MLSTFQEHFSNITDHRQQCKVTHELHDILLTLVVGVICGAEGWEAIEDVAHNKLDLLKKYGSFQNGVPVHDTIARVVSAICPQKLQQNFINWMKDAHQMSNGDIVAIDGKTVRGSYDKKSKKNAIHMVSAFASANGVVLGQVKTDAKSNEINAIPELLALLDIKGCIVTIDAMGCQKAIAKTIRANQADYVLALKGNQGHLQQAVRDFFDIAQETNFARVPHQFYEEVNDGHGRIEHRRYWLTSALQSIQDLTDKWCDLHSIGMVESRRIEGDKESVDIRYFITSLSDNIQPFSQAVRRHWGIENQLHWVLDVTFKEDESRIRRNNAAENMVVMRHLTFNLLKQETSCKKGIKAKRFKAALDSDYAEKVLMGIF